MIPGDFWNDSLIQTLIFWTKENHIEFMTEMIHWVKRWSTECEWTELIYDRNDLLT